jgi:hypothetical protein
VVFLFEASDSANSKMTDLAFFSKLDNFLKPQLEEVSDSISKHIVRNSKVARFAPLPFGKKGKKKGPVLSVFFLFLSLSPDSLYRYIYFNHMNLALKTTLATSRNVLTKEVLGILTDMHEDFNE